jgi:hypothetical protein
LLGMIAEVVGEEENGKWVDSAAAVVRHTS